MSVRAQWGALGAAPPAEDTANTDCDPFEMASSTTMKPVDLSTPVPVLDDRLRQLLRGEANLDACGVHCALKDLPDATCLACPVSKADDDREENAHKALLCRIGQEQEQVAMLLAVKQRGG